MNVPTEALGGLIGGIATALGIYASHRKERQAKRVADLLLRDLIVGHTGIPGVADRDGLDKRLTKQEHRLAAVVLNVQDISKELHPNGGASLADKVNSTHALAVKVESDFNAYRKDHP